MSFRPTSEASASAASARKARNGFVLIMLGVLSFACFRMSTSPSLTNYTSYLMSDESVVATPSFDKQASYDHNVRELVKELDAVASDDMEEKVDETESSKGKNNNEKQLPPISKKEDTEPTKAEATSKPETSDETKPQRKSTHNKQKPLNVIVFYPDDWTANDVGDANPILKTPTFTQLAKEGMRFTHNCVTTSICWISRATLFSGQYVSGHQSTYLFRPYFAAKWEQWKNSWPAQLQARANYWVGHIGKWQYQDKGKYKNSVFNFSSYFEGWMWNKVDGQDMHIANLAEREAIKFLQERPKDRPFAATVAFYPPKGVHSNHSTIPEFYSWYANVTHPELYDRDNFAYNLLPPFLQDNKTDARNRYLYRFITNGNFQETMSSQYAAISHIDHVCGNIIQELKKQGVYDDTMIIVTADNGEFHGAHALADKWYPYDESIRVPLIIKDPRMPSKKRGTTDDSFTLNIDLAETILGAAGLSAPKEMHGRDIADLYLDEPTSKEPWRQEFYYEFPDVNGKIPASTALVRKDWKYIHWRMHDHEQLFDMTNDPQELYNVVDKPEHAERKAEMKQRLAELRQDVFWPYIPETRCDPLWPAGTDLSNKPNCSTVLPDKCCDHFPNR